MSLRRAFGVAAGACALAVLSPAPGAGAAELTIPIAREKAANFAEHTCMHDRSCVRTGVLNCHRQTNHIGFCRIYLKRTTELQGSYTCDRLIRLAMDHETHRLRVTGLGRWHC